MTAKTLAVLIATSLLLAGCGNKGPLVLPSAPVADEAPTLEEPRPVPDPDALPPAGPEAESEPDTGADAVEPDDVPADPPTAG